ncbi:hypothetical protein I4F81_002226 [Pyropia yezoensis]|uniref:Uncharacterized protein n=1 Tax=Pyropia yezoensis TaxID=2788 RepID=A0ACC3BQ67_PYRYE|nr:hypothetical protein I4F81_002226 [Neopyropia yezoensis]
MHSLRCGALPPGWEGGRANVDVGVASLATTAGDPRRPATLFARAPDPLGFLIDAHGQTAGDIFLTGTAASVVMQGGANGDAPATPRLLRSYGSSRRSLVQAQRQTGLEGDSGGRGRTPLLVDLDGDGDLDLITLNYEVPPAGVGPRQRVYENVGGKFVRRPGTGLEDAGVERALLTDFDGDGRLDVVAFPFFRLYRATGAFAFADVTDGWMRRVPGGASAGRNTWAAAELDANNDGKWDLFLARNGSPDVLLLNGGADFFISAPLPATGTHHGDVTVGDFNNDGAVDLFLASTAPAAAPRKRRDVLLSGDGRGGFALAPAAATGVHVWTAAGGDSVQAFDADRDGRLDLLVGSGAEVAAGGPPGGWDLFLNTVPLPAQGGGHWLAVSVGRSAGRRAAATGATLRLTVEVGGGGGGGGEGPRRRRCLHRRVGGAGGSGSSDCLRVVHFGLGAADTVVALEVRWSDGSTVVRRDVPVDAVYTVTAA